MWTSKIKYLDNKQLCKVFIFEDNRAVTFSEVIAGWKDDKSIRQFCIALIAGLPFEAVFWELPAITLSSASKPFECVFVNSLQLVDIEPNRLAFESYFYLAADDKMVVAFENLGKDAVLVVPCPKAEASVYTHLARFIREGKAVQCHELLHTLGEQIENRLNSSPLWINTSGLGVHWLHVRLDSRPKYYTFQPYRIVN